MSDVFISYARSTAKQAQAAAEALRGLGYSVWLDDDLPAHRAYAQVIEEQLTAAKAALVIWSNEAVKSQWVMSEANRARQDRKLVQFTIDGARLPMPFDQIQCAQLADWTGDLAAPGWLAVTAGIAELTGRSAAPSAQGTQAAPPGRRKLSICVLPFANMSGDVEQEYFSDGISEDIITDLAKVSALSVIARNTAFTFKGAAVDVPQIARRLNVSHVLEGSVRKAGGRVRITAQLIDGVAGDHIWAERYDRELTDIFALQDEVVGAIVGALKLSLLPEEKKAIELRGTDNADAYNLYLMARQYYISGNQGDIRREEAIVRLCRRATEFDPNYARAWVLMALSQTLLLSLHGRGGHGGLAAAERAVALDPGLAEAHAVRAWVLVSNGADEAAWPEVETALRLDPESYEVNKAAGYVSFRLNRLKDAIHHFEKAAALMESDCNALSMLISCYMGIGDRAGARNAAERTLVQAQRMVAEDAKNGAAKGYGVSALAALGETERAKEWIDHALLIDPDNMNMCYNFACTLALHLKDFDGALDLLDTVFARAPADFLNHAKADPDLDTICDHPRFMAAIAGAEVRVAAEIGTPLPKGEGGAHGEAMGG